MHQVAEQIGRVSALDVPGRAIGKLFRSAVPAGPVKDALSGVPLGHALHPVLTDVPIGAWTSAVILDLIGGRDAQPAADRLIGVGIAAAVPTALTGVNDWADSEATDDSVRRVGVAHAVWNVVALGLFTGSLAARRGGSRPLGVALALGGAGVLSAGGALGGHLSYSKGLGVNRTAFETRADEWRDVLADAELAEGALRGAEVDGEAVVLARRGGRVYALAGHCAHRGGLLADGELVDGCVQCPLHGSRFRLEDGSVERGPSPYPQPPYEVRVEAGRISVRAAQATE
jgi:nitrite reductase/ring-hydroxylating ferredoxin subunit